MAPSSRAIVANSLVCEPWREHTELHAMALALLLSRARTCPQSPPLPGTPTRRRAGEGKFDRRFLDVLDSRGLRTEVARPRTHHRWVVPGLVDGGDRGWLLAPEARGRPGRFASRWSAMGACRWPSTCMA